MVRFITFSFILLLSVLFYLMLLNPDYVRIYLTPEVSYKLPLIALITISCSSGALFMFFIFFAKDTRRFIQTQKMHRKLRKEERVNNYYSKAINYMLSKRGEDAALQFNNALKENPGHVPSLLKLGDLCQQRNDLRKAEEFYRRASRLDVENTEAVLKIVHLKRLQGGIHEALELIDKTLTLFPTNAAAFYARRELLEELSRWDELALLQKTSIRMASGDAEQAAEQAALTGYEYEYGRQSIEAGDVEKARKAFKSALKSDRAFIPAHLGYVETMVSEGDTEEAANYLEKAYEETRSIILLIRLEDLLINLGEPSRLIRFYRNAVNAAPSDDMLKLFQAKLYFRLEMHDDALDILGGLDPGLFHPEVSKLKGGIYLKRNEYGPAIEEFLKVLDLRDSAHIPYDCSHCGHASPEWSGRCPQCKRWNTYGFEHMRACKI
jgi:lipopolysaccharide biosynthesis regulator YciM